MGPFGTAVFLLLTSLVVTNAILPPRFINNMNGFALREDQPIGKVFYTLLAVDGDDESNPIAYDIDSMAAGVEILYVDPASGNVSLRRNVDYESRLKRLDVIVSARDYTDDKLTTSVQVTLTIEDVNDNKPRFNQTTFSIEVPEDTPINQPIFNDITVLDPDLAQSTLAVSCYPNVTNDASLLAEYLKACNTFEIRAHQQVSNVQYTGDIWLKSPLDFETTPAYQLNLRATDGTLVQDQSFNILVNDTNDSPPVFTYAPDVTIDEGLPLYTNVTYVVAVDGDKTRPNPIVYDLSCTTGSATFYFNISRTSGVITNIAGLDRESADFSLGYMDLCIKARELIGSIPGNSNLTTATTVVRINLNDINDNKPEFAPSNFVVDIYENIPNDAPLQGLIMTVTDLDGGTANSYNFVLLNDNDRFAVFPDQGQSKTTAGVMVTDTSKIDYEVGPRQYILRIEARETLTSPALTGSATVTVNVLDVNDNSPQFSQDDYTVNVQETANVGSLVIDITATDPDTGIMGNAGIVYGLVGNGADKFNIDRRTGTVTVASCKPKPGVDACIDYEKTRQYDLTVTATDENGTGNSQTARLIINVLDVNDNRPVFGLSSYTASIFEGNTITVDPLLARASDLDSPTVRYNITGSDLWQIDPITANITARQPIKYEQAPIKEDASFLLVVIASDGELSSTVEARIFVLDTNDNSPIFQPFNYTETIDESTRGNVFVVTVTAVDQDAATTDNGLLEYSIESGAQGWFVIDPVNGDISTANNASFDYDTQRVYLMQVLARDGGNPQRTGTGSVTVSIRDANNKDPFFIPTTQRTEVYENVFIGTSVYSFTARDPDIGAILNYQFVEPIQAITPTGIQVKRTDYSFHELFEVDLITGIVRTARILDRDRASVVTLTVNVVDTSANPRQTGTGTLIVNILEYNDQHPYFVPDFYNVTIDEEQPIGAFVMTIIARDEDDAIAQYEILDDPQNLFSVSASTGVVTVRNRIDYEVIQRTTFRARATDNGFPPRSNTTDIYVTINNMNDNSPVFSQPVYSVTIPEHSKNSSSIVTVFATDDDLGDYGEVRYKLADSQNRFTVNSLSGLITSLAELDRETQSTISIQVTAEDSPLDPDVARKYTVPVYIILSDINDNNPIFGQDEYEATIIETIDIGAQVVQVFASDIDDGDNARIAFKKVAGTGDPNGYFDILSDSGRIVVDKSLRGRAGDYVFQVEARDLNGDPTGRSDTARVIIHVVEATNSPPVWIIPPRDNMTIQVLESQYLGMLVYDVEAVDSDGGASGIVDYAFIYQGNHTQRTPEFSINRVTGVIRAEIVYDREQVDRYVLLLSARDRGDPRLQAIRFLTVVVLDVNDNVPKFPMKDGKTIPKTFRPLENSLAGTSIGFVEAFDPDTIDEIYYSILAGDRETFRINATSGEISLKKALDRERQAEYTLDIFASNNISDFSVIRERRKRSTNPSIVTVRVIVMDAIDEDPVFTGFNAPNNVEEYYGCISSDAPFETNVVKLEVTDADSPGPAGIRFWLTSGNSGNTFAIDPISGMIYNNRLVDTVGTSVFILTAAANDTQGLFATTTVKIFVTKPENRVRLVLNQKSSEVRLFIQQLVRLLESDSSIQYACVSLIRDHVTAAGTVDDSRTDVYVAAATGLGTNYRVYSKEELEGIINTARTDNKNTYDALYVSSVGGVEEEGSFLKRTPVLAVLIIVILLIVLALILFCLACFCIADSKKRKMRKTEAQRFTVVSQEPVKEVNPVYDNRAFVREEMPVPVQYQPNEEYAVVQKRRPPSDEVVVAPVPVVQESFIEPARPPIDEGPVPVIETVVMEDEPQVPESYPEPEPVIVTEVIETQYVPDEPEPVQAVYIPDLEREPAVYIPEPEPEPAVYIPEPEPQPAVYIPEPEPEPAVYIPEPEPEPVVYIPEPEPAGYIPEPEQGMYIPDEEPELKSYLDLPDESDNEDNEIMVEVRDDTPLHSPPPSPHLEYGRQYDGGQTDMM